MIILILFILLFFVYYMSINEHFNDNEKECIYIFYHIYCNEYTLDVIKDQINKIIFSGLYHKCDNIYCFLVGKKEFINICKNYIISCGKKFSIEDIGINDKTYERFTLLKIKKYIKLNDKFLYLH